MVKLRSSEDGRTLYFEDAVLAVVETNKNLDVITEENLQELAATIALQPLDEEHKDQRVVGMFTGGSVNGKKLLTSGCIFAARFPDIANGILGGEKMLSLSANAARVFCSECGAEMSSLSRCDHLSASMEKRREMAWFKRYSGLTSDGGAVTVRPAGTGTEFNKIRLVASIQTDLDKEDILVLNRVDELLKKYGMSIRR